MKQFSFKSAVLLFVGALLFSAFVFKPATTNFSGKWKLNEGKSELGDFANFATKLIEAQQYTDSMGISRTAASFDGNEATTIERLTFDGKESESTLFGESKKKSVASWSQDGTALTITYNIKMEFNGQSNEIKGTEVWTMADEGKTLVVKNSASSSFGELETKSVYEKQ
ncbi:MAG: hypothetical protein ACQUYJ_16960 [Ferruginibacter sp.]